MINLNKLPRQYLLVDRKSALSTGCVDLRDSMVDGYSENCFHQRCLDKLKDLYLLYQHGYTTEDHSIERITDIGPEFFKKYEEALILYCKDEEVISLEEISYDLKIQFKNMRKSIRDGSVTNIWSGISELDIFVMFYLQTGVWLSMEDDWDSLESDRFDI